MEFADEYQGHVINAWTEEHDSGWAWVFTIDAETLVKSEGRPLASEESALHKAIAEARRRIDDWPKA